MIKLRASKFADLDIIPTVAGIVTILLWTLPNGPLVIAAQNAPKIELFSVTPILAAATLIGARLQRRRFSPLLWLNVAWLVIGIIVVGYLVAFAQWYRW